MTLGREMHNPHVVRFHFVSDFKKIPLSYEGKLPLINRSLTDKYRYRYACVD